MIHSARSVMPGIHIAHIADASCPQHKWADEVVRVDKPFGLIRSNAHARLDGEWIFADVDVIFRKDVSEVFKDDFEIACCDRKGTKWEGTRYEAVMPFNNGVVFSKCRDFWVDLAIGVEILPQEWWGWCEQLAFNTLVQSGRYRIKVLPSSYNFTPLKRDDDISNISVLHFKGNRKAWMLADYGAE